MPDRTQELAQQITRAVALWTWRETVEEGKWHAVEPEPVLVSASYGLMSGVWYKVKEGVQWELS